MPEPGTYTVGLLTPEGEVKGTEYEPKTVELVEEDGQLVNEDSVEWPAAESTWGRITKCWFENENYEFVEALQLPKRVGDGDRARFREGGIGIDL